MSDAQGPSSFGGARPGFPSTCWSRFMAPPAGGDRRGAIEELAQRYWRPIHAYILLGGWSKTPEDAKDLAQDFFIWVLEGDFLEKPDPAQGRFRSFLRVALKHFLINVDRDARRLKRGGDRPVLTLGELQDWAVEDRRGRPPEDVLDDGWRREILTASVAQLERELKQQGKEVQFRVFEEFHLDGAPEPAYRDVAAKLGISEVDVTNYLARTKARFRALIAEQVSQTVLGERDLREELRELFGSDR